MKKNENRIFQFSTVESQEAFICWCINWINYKDHKLYNLGKDFLNMVITDDKGRKKFEITENMEVKIIRQYASIDILLIVDNKYIVIIDDKINSFNHSKISAKDIKNMVYRDKLINLLSNKDNVAIDGRITPKTDKKQIDNANKRCEELGLEEFKKQNIIEVYIKTGKFNAIDKQVCANKVNACMILNVIKKYIKENDIIEDFYNCMKFTLGLYDNEKVNNIAEKKEIKLYETFVARYMIYNCFNINVDMNYTGRMDLRLKAGGVKLTDKTSIWTPILYSNKSSKWQNVINKEGNIIIETNNSKKSLKTESTYRYVFARRKDSFNDIYFEFIGVFYLGLKESTEEKRVWKKYELKKETVTLDYKKLEKELDEKLK